MNIQFSPPSLVASIASPGITADITSPRVPTESPTATDDNGAVTLYNIGAEETAPGEISLSGNITVTDNGGNVAIAASGGSAPGNIDSIVLIADVPAVSVQLDANTLGITFLTQIARELVGGEPYEGSYSVAPSTEAQTLQTNGKLLTADIVVDAIPQNYGLITWNGSYLTVS